MHPIFIPWCAGASRHERLVRKHVPDSDPGCALRSTSMTALHGRNVPNCRPMVDGGMRKCSAGACPPQGSGRGVAESAVLIRRTKPQLRLFIPWCAGTSRHGRLVRKWCYAASSMLECHRPPLRHSYENAPTLLSSAPLNPSIPRSRHSGPSIRHSREGGNPEGRCGLWQ